MANKPKTVNKPKTDPAALTISAPEDKVDETTARVMSEPEVRSASIIQKFEGDIIDINYLASELRTQNKIINAGDIGRVESMLGAQAHTLDALFAQLSRRSHSNMVGGCFEVSVAYMKLALRAQSQAVRTLEVLSEIKRPKHIAFVAQANISGGHQQVNNASDMRVSEIQNAPIQLSGDIHELLPDAGTSGKACRNDQTMEAMRKVDRTKIPSG